MGSIVTAMVHGALIGGGVAAVTGGDVGKGLLLGAAGGGIGGAFSSGAAGGTSGAAAGSQAGMLASQTAGFTAAELAGWGGATAAGTSFFGGTAAAMEAGQTAGFSASELAGWGGATAADTAAATAGTGAGTGVWDTVVNAGKQANSFVNNNKGLLNVGTSVYGMTQAQALQQQALQAQQQANLWGSSGGQALGASQLQNLMSDPGQVAANDPAYRLRMQAAQRAMAGYGQNSGAMAVAGANASTDWYNARMQQLAGVAGVNNSPAAAAQVGIQGVQAGNQLMNQSLKGLGASLDQWFGGR